MEIGISTLLDGYNHIYMLNGYSFPKDKTTIKVKYVICINGGVIIKMNSKESRRRFNLLILTAKMYYEIV